MTRAGAERRSLSNNRTRQQERCQMVDRPSLFDAVPGRLPRGENGPGIVHQHVHPLVAGLDLGRQAADVGLGAEIGHDHVEHRAGGTGAGPGRGGLAPGLVPGHQGHVGPPGGQSLGRRQPDAVGAAGEDDLLTGYPVAWPRLHLSSLRPAAGPVRPGSTAGVVRPPGRPWCYGPRRWRCASRRSWKRPGRGLCQRSPPRPCRGSWRAGK